MVKIRHDNGEILTVFAFEKEPMFFETKLFGSLYPTVYFTWLVPDAFPVLLINENVLSFLQSGADLMLQGVVRRGADLPNFEKDATIALSIISGDEILGPVAICQSFLSSMEMLANGMKGRGATILHYVGDFLWEFGSRKQPPKSSAVLSSSITPFSSEKDIFPALEMLENLDSNPKADEVEVLSDNAINASADANRHESEDFSEQLIVDSMENLLKRCFLAALKYRVSKTQLPLDLGQFYSQYLLACLPPDRRIDMKKTVYKKFSNFLNEINSNEHGQIVKVSVKTKGMEVINEINWQHPLLKAFKPTDEVIVGKVEENKMLVKVDEFYAVTEPVISLFNCPKGTLFSIAQTREIITTYVKNQGLCEENKVCIRDSCLVLLFKITDTVDWNTLFQKIISKMTKTYVVTTPDGRKIVRKMDLPKITFRIENRAGNKKVTLVNNLGVFGIDCKAFCQKVQLGVATSGNIVNDCAECDGPQVVIQGNQIHFMYELLMSEYGVDKKYMAGLERMLKKK